VFIRRKKNKSGVISVQIVDKSTGTYKMLRTIGSSCDPLMVQRLEEQARQWIKNKTGILELDFFNEIEIAHRFLDGIEQISVEGTTLLLGKIFDEIGFGQIDDEMFRHLVMARLCYPASKLKTTDYLSKYHGIHIDVQQLYRYLDKLYNTQKEQVQKISYEHTLQILHGQINIVFYDVTTLYFEIDDEDDLRKTGFSKEGRHQHPQIVLGLLVSAGGYPLAYEIFEGNKFEGHTMLPVLETFKRQYGLEKLVVVADSGLLSNDNIEQLRQNNYDFILGARIKNEPEDIQSQILQLNLTNGSSAVIHKDQQIRLVISYSDARAKKDKANREKGIKKLEKQIKSGKLTKANLTKRGYNKFLKLEGEIKIFIDADKLKADSRWDGLKGYLTNTSLSQQEVLENYKQLWKIEKAFRVAKSEIKIRPVYHYKQRRIEAHICIAFVAYKVYKELERQLKAKGSHLSPERAIEIAKTIYQITIRTPLNKEKITRTLILNNQQEYLVNLFGLQFRVSQ
jgi:transposase